MMSVESHSTSVREKGGKKERTGLEMFGGISFERPIVDYRARKYYYYYYYYFIIIIIIIIIILLL